MYNISKVKQWIKKSAKTDLIYDPQSELVSDNCAMLRVTPEMKPALLEAFGHLNGGWLPAGREVPATMAEIMELKPDAKNMIDSTLMFMKGTGRILYYPDTGQKVCIKQIYVDLFEDFELRHLKASDDGKRVYVLNTSGEVIGLILPFRTQSDVLESFEFKIKDFVEETVGNNNPAVPVTF